VKLSCYVIGISGLTKECIKKLIKNQFEILGVVTNEPLLIAECQQHAILCYPNIEALLATDVKPFGLLFSIINYAHVPDELITKAELAINYHDAPLPRYAGVHATSWALSEKSDTHGITWHEMTTEYDSGALLEYKIFEIDPDAETTFTLNMTCFEEALGLFEELLAKIKSDTLKKIPQDLEKRSYYARHQKLLGNGLIDCAHQSAEAIEHLIRVLDFGDPHEYTNRFAVAKLLIASDVYFPRIAIICPDKTPEVPAGTVVSTARGGLRVATKTRDIVFQEIRDADGVLLTDTALQLLVKQQTISFTQQQIMSFTKLSTILSGHEFFWKQQLAKINPINVPCLHSAQLHVKNNDAKKLETPLLSLETVLAYFYHINFGGSLTVWLKHNEWMESIDATLQIAMNGFLPLNFTLLSEHQRRDITNLLLNTVKVATEHTAYLKDIIIRYPELSDMPVAKKQIIIERVDSLAQYYQPVEQTLLTIVVDKQYQCQLFVNTAAIQHDAHFCYFIEHLPQQLIVLDQQLQQHKPLKETSILSVHDKQQIAIWNNTQTAYPAQATIHSLFEQQVERTPNATAIQFETGETMTYRDLNARANQLARYLQQFEVSGKFVAICLSRSINMIVSILSTLKAGAAYVPMSITDPSKRLEFMLQETEASVLITEDDFMQKFENYAGDIVCLQRDWQMISTQSSTNIDSFVLSNNSAVCIYTSGSTGLPKGVVLRHQGIVNCLVQVSRALNFSGKDSILASTTYIFDVSMTEFFMPLHYGAQMLLVSDETRKDSHKLVALLEQASVSVIQAVPTALQLLLTAGWSSDEGSNACKIISMGEPLSNELASGLIKAGANLYNLFGPSETSIYVTLTPIDNPSDISIGHVMKNVTAYVMTPDLKLLPPMVPGELCIGGVALAKGYLKRPEQDKSFVVVQHDNGSVERLYRTGDLVYQLPDGGFKGLGRIDKQVKLHGYRIELGEIQHYLQSYPGIKQAVVLAKTGNFDTKQLVAYIVPELQQQEKIQASALRSYLEQFLPQHMLPAHFVALTHLPQLPSGKVNQHALLANTDYMSNTSKVVPSTEIEKILQIHIAEVLNISIEQVGIEDDLFTIGMDSITCFNVKQQLSKHNAQFDVISSNDFYQCKTIRRLGERYKQYQHGMQSNQVIPTLNHCGKTQNIHTDFIALTPIQHWFFELNILEPQHWNQNVLLSLSEQVDAKIIPQALQHVIQQHDIFKSRFSNVMQKSCQILHQDVRASLVWAELKMPSEGHGFDHEPAIMNMHNMAQSIENQINVEQGSFVQATLIHQDKQRFLMLSIHHLVVDGVSWSILLRDFFDCYSQLKDGGAIDRPKIATHRQTDGHAASFAAWSKALSMKAQSASVVSELLFWQMQLPKKCQAIPAHLRANKSVIDAAPHVLASCISEKVSVLQYLAKQNNVSLYQWLVAVFLQSLHEITHWNELFIELESHGRDSDVHAETDWSNTVGWFTALFPLRFDVAEATTPHDYLALSKTVLEQVPHLGIGFGLLRYLSNDAAIRETLTSTTPSLVGFNYWGQFNNLSNTDFQFAALDLVTSPKNTPIHALDVSMVVIKGQLHVFCHYDPSILSKNAATLLISACENKVKSMLKASENTALTAKQEIKQNCTVEKSFPLLPVQQGMLYHSLHSDHGESYLVQSRYQLKQLNVNVMEKAWQALINRHEALRSEFHWDAQTKQYQQMVKTEAKLPWQYHDFSYIKADAALLALVQQDRKILFDFGCAPLMRVTVVRVGHDNYELIWTYHHILIDGWSMSLLLDELYQLYVAYCKNLEPQLPLIYSQQIYTQYFMEKRIIQRAADLYFWEKYLSTIKPSQIFDLQLIEERAHQETESRFSAEVLDLSEELSAHLRQYAKKQGITLDILMQVVWGYLLSQYNRTNDMTLGTVVSDRGAEGGQALNIIGIVINTLVIHLKLDRTLPFADLLKQAFSNMADILQHNLVSLSEISELIGLPAEQLFQCLFVFGSHQFIRQAECQQFGLYTTHSQLYNPTHYPLTLLVVTGRNLSLHLSYDNSLLKSELMSALMQQYELMLNHCVNLLPEQTLQALPLPVLPEHAAVFTGEKLAYSQLPVHKRIALQAQQHPDKIAVRDPVEMITYFELDTLANQFAHYLLQAVTRVNSKRHLRIAVCMDSSASLMICVLGILKAGGFYIPIDANYPQQRIKRILENSQPDLLILGSNLPSALCQLEHTIKVITFDTQVEKIKSRYHAFATESPNIPVSWNDPCYCVYTSGSTGIPKGVLLPHRTVTNLSDWEQSDCVVLGENRQKNVAMTSAFGFDQFEAHGFYALIHGHCLFMVSAEMRIDLPALLKFFIEHQINHAYLPTSMLTYFLDVALKQQVDLSHLYDLIVAGEALFVNDTIKTFFEKHPHCCLKNYYGPSEANVVSAYTIPANANWSLLPTRIPIGQPIANTTLKVIDPWGKVVTKDMTGELLIAGDCVGLGYLDDSALTQERFLNLEGKTYYKTGDLVKVEDDELIYIGRLDNQIKVRGCRVEPGEIENVLLMYPSISEVAVIAVHSAGKGTTKELVAFFTVENDEKFDETDVRQFLLKHLPKYMLPSVFMQVDYFALTGNGKKDRNALLTYYEEYRVASSSKKIVYIPKTENQKKLTEIWLNLFGDRIPKNEVSGESDFFALGGHSILAIELLMLIDEKMGVGITMRELLANPTIADLASFIDQKREDPDSIVSLGNKKAIFLIHPIGGTVFWYENLARHVTSNIDIYGISDPGIENGKSQQVQFQSITEMAGYYIESMKKKKTRGGYIVGGASSGGIIALEAARLLQLQGEKVEAVLLFDSWAINPPLLENEDEFKAVMKKQILQQYHHSKYFNMDFWLNLQWSRAQLLRHHHIQLETNADFRVILFRATEHYPVFKMEPDPENYWRIYFTNPNQLSKIDVPGDHESMFNQDNVKVLASKLDDLVKNGYNTRLSEGKLPSVNSISELLQTLENMGALHLNKSVATIIKDLHQQKVVMASELSG
jgi:amino acid adenylation domain-containing protein/non-ribosomal peptide synthase protein (TIGR01720 family)